MASQVVGADSLELLEIHSYVRGYHAYMDVWNPVQGLTLITGPKINRGAGYGLEVPCVYRLYGPKIYVERLNELVDSLRKAGLI